MISKSPRSGKFFLILIIFLVQFKPAISQEKIDLSGVWDFSIDTIHSNDDQWTTTKFKSESWDKLIVPGNWDTENAYAGFRGTGYYRRSFEVPKNWRGGSLRLHFDAVYEKTKVWVNGEYVGEHVGGYTPFEFDVSDVIKPGKQNTIAVSANNKYNRGAWWYWGGISRPVYLVNDPDQRIVRQEISAEPSLKIGNSVVKVSVLLKNNTDKTFSESLTAKIVDVEEKKSFGEMAQEEVMLAPNEAKEFSFQIKLSKEETTLWDTDNPYLYKLITTLGSDQSPSSNVSKERFGIRKVEVQGTKLLLNGKVQYLNGFNRVSDHRAYGNSEPEHLVKFDIDAMKAMGCNFTRIMHSPQSPVLLDYCDEVGILLIEEIPVWGKGDPQLTPDNPLTKQWLTEMIERDYNHPSIIGWSVANEIADKKLKGRQMSPKVYNYVKTMIAHVETLDKNRLKTYVSFTATRATELGTDPADLCDIVCYNSYGGAINQAKKLHKTWPNKPIFFAEIGKSQVGEVLPNSGLHESLVSQIKGLEKLDYVIGSSLWTYNDYRSTYGGTPKSQNRAWGAYNVWRQPKKAAYDIRALYSKEASEEKLPTLLPIPEQTPEGKVYIEAIVPLKNSCMIGFTVLDKKDNYEIEYKLNNADPNIVKVEGVRGAAKVYDLKPGAYTFRIRSVNSEGVKGEWSPVYQQDIK